MKNLIKHPFFPGAVLFVITLGMGLYGVFTGDPFTWLQHSVVFMVAWCAAFVYSVGRAMGWIK